MDRPVLFQVFHSICECFVSAAQLMSVWTSRRRKSLIAGTGRLYSDLLNCFLIGCNLAQFLDEIVVQLWLGHNKVFRRHVLRSSLPSESFLADVSGRRILWSQLKMCWCSLNLNEFFKFSRKSFSFTESKFPRGLSVALCRRTPLCSHFHYSKQRQQVPIRCPDEQKCRRPAKSSSDERMKSCRLRY